MHASLTMYLNTSNVIEHKVFDRANQRPVNSATVTATLKDSAGNVVGGEEWPATLAYLLRSRGVYRHFTVPDLALIAGDEYELVIVANDGAGHESTVVKSVAAKVQRC